MNNNYIRFFVSSTFDDMKLERDLMQEIFAEIEAEYSQQNWQIEMIDLRWGISKEAGLDNKTMQICKEELSRCQQLSPKPNFIILLGDRYGWIPIPEVLPIEVYKSLQMNLSERLLFCSWYRLDENILPNGAYILKSRYSEKGIYVADFTKDDIWKEEVVKPLSSMFERNHCTLYGTSATEQEIELGALNVEDAKEHVIAYIRHLRNIPEEVKNTYVESDKEKEIKDLERRVREKLSRDNIVSTNPDFAEYKTDVYKSTFKSSIKQHIRSIINNVIKERNQATVLTENQIHIEYAIKEASQFVGREKELGDINKYLHDTTTNYGLWYIAPSGMGKSVLLAKVVSQSQEEFDIVCRFCGTTDSSIDALSLYSSLYKNLWHKDTRNREKKFEELNYNKLQSYQQNYSDAVGLLLQNMQLEKPILIVIDSLDRLDEYSFHEFSLFKWLNIGDRSDIKIIISSTIEQKYNIAPSFLRKIKLEHMGEDAMELIMHQIKYTGRRLSDKQKTQITTVLNKSDKSPLYLKLLGRILSTIPSWQDLSDIRLDLQNLMGQYIKQICDSSQYSYLLIRRINCWLAVCRWGMTDREIYDMLSRDEECVMEIESKSFHILNNERGKANIPPIIWIRLRHALQPLLRQDYTQAGQLITYFHDGLKKMSLSMFRKLSDEVYLQMTHLFLFYESRYPNKHALLESSRCLYNAFIHQKLSQNVYLNHMLSNLDYIVYKKIYFPTELYQDYDWAIKSISEKKIKEILRTAKHQLQSLHNYFAPRDVRMALANLPVESPLRIAMEQQEDFKYYMKDILSYSPRKEALFYMDDVGFCPCMSQDGKIIASLKDNGCKSEIVNLEDCNIQNLLFSINALEIQVDDTLHYIAVRYSDLCELIDTTNKEQPVIYHHVIGINGWISLSANGKRLLVGESTEHVIIYNIEDKKIEVTSQNIIHAKLSPSGQYIWSIEKRNALITRYDIQNQKNIPFKQLYIEDDNGQLPREELRIISCSDECCIAGDYLIQHIVSESGKDQYTYVEISVNINLPRQHPHEFLHRTKPIWVDPIGTCKYLTDDGDIKDLGNIDLGAIHCINGDFTIGFSATEGRIFDFQKELGLFRCLKVREDGYRNTFFTLSSSYSGYQLAVSSYGVSGPWGMLQQSMLRVADGKTYSWSPVHPNEPLFMSLPANAISPDGSMLAVSAYLTEKVFLVDTADNRIIWQQKNPRKSDHASMENAMRVFFSEDGNYLSVLTGDQITPADGTDCDIFIYNIDGIIVNSIYNNFWQNNDKERLDINFYSREIIPSHNNRFLFLGGSIYDLIDEKFLYKDCFDTFFDNISPSTLDAYSGSTHFNLLTKKASTDNRLIHLNAISPSGKNYFLLDNFKLYLTHWPDCNDRFFLRDEVRACYPALDDRFIYILDKNYHFILFDTINREDLQIATKGFVNRTDYLGIKVCAQGLIVFNSESSELSLFTPDEKYGVNKAAITTFVKRWRLEDKTLQEPTAICPMCGKSIDYKYFSSCQLKEYNPDDVHSTDWDWPRLRNHQCPHCNAELQFNPYIL